MTANIVFRLSGGNLNTNPNNSIGGAMSSTEINSEELNNLFDRMTKSENINEITDHRCIYIYNNGDDDFINGKVYIDNITPEGSLTEFKIGIGSLNSTPGVLSSEISSPAGITFNSHFAFTKKSIPDIPANSFVPVWIKRKAKNTPLGTNIQESFTLKLTGAQ